MKSSYLAIILVAMSLTFGATSALAGQSSIPAADLAALTEEQIRALGESEFAAFAAEVAYERARQLDGRLDAYIKEGKERRKVADLNAKAAKTEYKAADRERKFQEKAMQSVVVSQVQERARAEQPDRYVLARARLDRSELEGRQADVYVDWRTLEAKAMGEFVDVTKARLVIADLERDLARVRAIMEASGTAAQNHDIGKLEAKLSKAQMNLAKAEAKYAKLRDAADLSQGEYARLSEQEVPVDQPFHS